MQACATRTRVPISSRYGDKAQTIISPNYQYLRGQKIVIMPFQATGKGRPESELGVTDKFAVKLMELGLYTIIDKGTVENFYQGRDIGKNITLSNRQLELIKKELGIDLVFYGTVNYTHVPSSSYSKSSHFGSSGGSSGDSSGGSRGDHYLVDSESLNAVSTATGEVMITSYVSESFCGSLSQEMAYSIGKKVSPTYLPATEENAGTSSGVRDVRRSRQNSPFARPAANTLKDGGHDAW